MGIRGLETFLDNYYNSESREKIFETVRLGEFKLVIDGNLFIHFVSSLFKQNEYGGNYYQLYEKLKRILAILKDSIEIVIFDGAKESLDKFKYRFDKKVSRIANIELEADPYTKNFKQTSPNAKNAQANYISTKTPETSQPTTQPIIIDPKVKHLEDLQQVPPLFSKMIMYEILHELNINYAMTEHMADYAIALYANGHNPKSEKYTVLSKASFFNLYNLEKGYMSTKYLKGLFENDMSGFDPAKKQFPIFYMSKLLEFFQFESHLTWIYFCIMLGNNDDIELKRNVNYFKLYNIDTRNSRLLYEHLLAHMRVNEKSNLQHNFAQIRRTYRYNQEVALRKIDELVDLFEMNDHKYTLVDSLIQGARVDDFDRLFLNIKHLNCVFLNCMIEDCANEESAFTPAIEFLRMIYWFQLGKPNGGLEKIDKIEEYIRVKGPTSQKMHKMKLVYLNSLKKVNLLDSESNKFLAYIRNLKSMEICESDKTVQLLLVSILVWENWLRKTVIDKDSVKVMIDSVFVNIFVLSIKTVIKNDMVNVRDLLKVKEHDFIIKDLQRIYGQSLVQLNEIAQSYDRILKNKKEIGSSYVDEYFEQDLKIVHRLNELQSVYYMIGALNKIMETGVGFLTPDKFLNCYFSTVFIKRNSNGSSDLNNNKIFEENVFNIEKLLAHNSIGSCFESLISRYADLKKTFTRRDLNEMLAQMTLI